MLVKFQSAKLGVVVIDSTQIAVVSAGKGKSDATSIMLANGASIDVTDGFMAVLRAKTETPDEANVVDVVSFEVERRERVRVEQAAAAEAAEKARAEAEEAEAAERARLAAADADIAKAKAEAEAAANAPQPAADPAPAA